MIVIRCPNGPTNYLYFYTLSSKKKHLFSSVGFIAFSFLGVVEHCGYWIRQIIIVNRNPIFSLEERYMVQSHKATIRFRNGNQSWTSIKEL